MGKVFLVIGVSAFISFGCYNQEKVYNRLKESVSERIDPGSIELPCLFGYDEELCKVKYNASIIECAIMSSKERKRVNQDTVFGNCMVNRGYRLLK